MSFTSNVQNGGKTISIVLKILKINLRLLRRQTIIKRLAGNDKFYGFNLSKPGVVEFRMMESSLSERKIGRWIRGCVGFVESIKLRKWSKFVDFEECF